MFIYYFLCVAYAILFLLYVMLHHDYQDLFEEIKELQIKVRGISLTQSINYDYLIDKIDDFSEKGVKVDIPEFLKKGV